MLTFDGVLDHILVADHSNLDITSDFTIELWVNASDTTGVRYLTSKWSSSGLFINQRSYALALDSGEPVFSVSSDGTLANSITVSSGVQLEPNQWYHLAGVYDGSEIKLLINGTEAATSSYSNGISATAAPLLVAALMPDGINVDAGTLFEGSMDEIRLWNTAGSDSIIANNLNLESDGSETGLVACYQFNSSTGVIALNIEGTSGLNGVMVSLNFLTDSQSSTAVIGNTTYATQNSRVAIWPVLNSAYSNGLRLQGNISENENFVAFGQNDSSGTTTADEPLASGYSNFKRLKRTWYFDESGSDSADFSFVLSEVGIDNIVPGGDSYVLLFRSGETGNFVEVSNTFSIAKNGATVIVQNDSVRFDQIEVSDGYYTLGTTDQEDSALPVDLSLFEAHFNDQTIEIVWTTEAEVNTLEFQLERRTPSANFSKIATLPAAGNSNTAINYAFTDNNIELNTTYHYRLLDRGLDGTITYHDPLSVTTSSQHENPIRRLILYSNFPNPFNSVTNIAIEIAAQAGSTENLSVKVFDISGRLIKSLFDEKPTRNQYLLQWDATNNVGRELPSGIYFLQVRYGKSVTAQRIALTK